MTTQRPRFINHVEMIFQPGEREAARTLFESLGFEVSDFGPWLVVSVEPATANGVDNVMYASEPVPAQQRFEDALAKAIANDPEATAALKHYRGVRVEHPQYNFHFGASMASYEDWEQRTAQVKETVENNPLLKGRVDVSVFNPGDPGAVGAVHQTFVLTDILATGTLQTGVIFELQWYPRNADGELDWEELTATSTYTDPATIV
jgi:hypothetical protein